MSRGEPHRQADYPGRPLSFYVTLGFFALGVALILMILLTLSGFGGIEPDLSDLEDLGNGGSSALGFAEELADLDVPPENES